MIRNRTRSGGAVGGGGGGGLFREAVCSNDTRSKVLIIRYARRTPIINISMRNG